MRSASILMGLIFVGFLSFQTEAMAQTSGQISVSGKEILKDNQPWVPKSITVNNPEHVIPETINFIQFYGADAVRIFVAEDNMDPSYKAPSPKMPSYDRQLIPQILNAVYTARNANIPVILVMTSWAQGYDNQLTASNNGMWLPACLDGANLPTPKNWVSYPSGLKGEHCGPSTSRAWQTLINPPAGLTGMPPNNYSIKKDPGVMFEVYNEPSSTSDNVKTSNGIAYFSNCYNPNVPTSATSCELTSDWTAWKSDYQNVINDIRGFGAKNVVLVDGLGWAKLFPDVNDKTYLPTDPSSPSDPQIIYAEHPYLSATYSTPAIWDAWFGTFAQQHPFMVTEFNSGEGGNCFSSRPTVASQLLEYLDQNQIGVNIWAYDQDQSIFANGPPVLPTTVFGNKFAWQELFAENLTTSSGDTETCSGGDTDAAGWLFYNYFQVLNKTIAPPVNLVAQTSEDGFSLTAFWQSAGSNLQYVAAILPQSVPSLYSPPEGSFPPIGTTDVKNATSLQFNNLAPGTYQVEVWSYDPNESVTTNLNGMKNKLYSSPAILSNITLNGNAHLQILDPDFPFITDNLARITAPDPTPDGEKDGELLIENNANNQHGMFQNLTEGAVNVTHTFSVAVKAFAPEVAVDPPGANMHVMSNPRDLSLVAFSNRLNANIQNAVCDPSTGTLQLQYPAPQLPTPMVYLGSGYYLCTVIFTQETEGTQVWIKLNNPDFMQDSGENQSLWSYTGDGISRLEIWNPQLFKIAQ